MEKESVKKFDLEAAFKALDEIEIPQVKGIKANRVDLKERFVKKPATETLVEDYYDVSNNEDLEEAQDEREAEVAQAKLARIEKIVDLDAESADDLLPSYVGKVIIQCPQCMTLFYKNPEDIEHSDENPDIVNINEVCQHCGNASGYTLIGKVDSVSEEEADKYETAEGGEENELDLDFEEPTEEVDAEGTGEGAEEMSDEEFDELNLELEEIPEEEEAKESLNLSKEAPSDFETEHKSENLTLNEEATDESLNNSEAQKEAEEGSELKTENESENLTLNEAKYDAELTVHDTWKVNDIEAADEEEAEEIAQEKIDNGEEDDYSEYDDGIQVTKIAEGLNEEVDKDLDKKLKAHNDYIAYLQQMIKQEEEALKKAENEEIKAAIQRRLDAFNADLEAALPDAVKSVPEVAADELADNEPAAEEPAVEEEPKDEEEAPVEEQLTEDAAEEEKLAEGNEVNYVDYKHSYCHILEPKLKALNYLVNVKKVEPKILKGYILKLLKDPEVRWTEKEKEFKKNIEAKEDNYDILNYVKNSVEKAKEIKVKVDENGELAEGLNEGFDGCLYEVLTESLNKSEEAPSKHETENGSENLTLNEDASSEIDAIIASWDFNESLNEEGDLDAILDSPEFKKPVSDAEVESIRNSLGECADQKLAEDIPDKDIADIVNSWGSNDKPAEEPAPKQLTPKEANDQVDIKDIVNTWESCDGPECKEGYTGNPAERTTHLEYTDDNPADGKAVLPDNIEKQLTEAKAKYLIQASDEDGEVIEEFEVEGNDPIAEFEAYVNEHGKDFYDITLIDLKDYSIVKNYSDGVINENLKEGEECKDGKCEDDLQPAIDARKGPAYVEKPLEEYGENCEKPLKEEDEVPAEEEAPVKEPVEEPVVDEPAIPENSEEVSFTTEEVKEVATDVAQALSTPVEDEEEAEKQAEEIAEVVDEKVDAAVEEKVEEANEDEKSEEAAEEPDIEGEPANDLEFDEESVDDLDECSLNKHIDDYLKEVYSNVKCFEATDCRLTEGKLIVEGKISFNSGKEKLTMFEFLPAYCEGKLFFEGYNKDFSEDKAFTLNCSINESKTLITESFGYKYKINENLVEGLK